MGAQKKILIVDDSIINRKILRKILETKYCVLEAENGQQGLDILNAPKGEEISLIVLDVVMPVLDGIGFLKEIKKYEKIKNIPIIVATQEFTQQKELQILKLGAIDFLPKPYSAAIIKQRVSNTIEFRETASLVNAVEKDYVTNVYNAGFFIEMLGKLLKENPKTDYDIICSDIENFKLINDLLGVKKGDEILRYLADNMRELCNGVELIGRIGSDNIAIVVKRPSKYSEEMFAAENRRFNQFPVDINMRVRFGIYSIDDRDMELRVMTERSIFAAKEIKGQYGESYLHYNNDLREQLVYQQSLLSDMESGIERKEFVIYLQPKYNLATKQLSGAEALVRWQHPKYGFLGPGEFIPLFEQNGYISNLDAYVWEETCIIMRKIIDAGDKLVPISVNVSRVDLYKKELPDLILGITKKYKIDPQYLHLEVTESAYAENAKQIITSIKRLHDMGFSIEMDDFGSGYSSLNMLGELPIDILKLDIKFIQNEMKKDGSKNILSFVISLAKWLGLLVVAEGVETQEQVDRLLSMECNYVQGYFFSKPIPEEEFLQKVRNEDVDEKSMLHTQQTLQPAETVVERIGDKSKKTMLITDDIELNRAILRGIFKEQFNFVETDNGASALEYLKKGNKVDIILLDLIMPVMNGYEFLTRIKQEKELKDIPVIVTSQTGEQSEVKALKLGAHDIISKPYTPIVCRKRVENALNAQKSIK